MQEKKCFKCGETKPLINFTRHSQKRDGYNPSCKQCNNKHYVSIEFGNKTCIKCQISKDVSFFSRNKKFRDGRCSKCKECFKNDAKKHDKIKTGTKKCTRCEKDLDVKEFYSSPYHKSGLMPYCKTCDIVKFYGITSNDYDILHERCGDKCSICKEEVHRLYIDHNHETGQIRGLLCQKCNIALGHFGDKLDGLLKAIEYLKDSENSKLFIPEKQLNKLKQNDIKRKAKSEYKSKPFSSSKTRVYKRDTNKTKDD